MFRAAAGGWEPYKVRQKVVKVKKPKTTTTATTQAPDPAEAANGDAKTQDGVDTEMKDATEGDQTANNEASAEEEEYEEQTILEEDTTSDEGAVYAMHQGKIVNWGCFFALLTHIYNTLSPPFHTPILLISQPAWTSRDREIVTQFIFEKFKVPAFSMMDSAAAVAYGYGAQTATIIDIGYEKADVTAIVDHLTSDDGRGIALEGCGGEAMTQRLHQILGPKGFTRDMCEQLKKSNICEILPAGTPLPVASGAAGAPLPKPVAAPPPGRGPEMPRTAVNGDPEEDDGVLDVAAIVSGNPSEYLAKKEREKAERAAARKNAAAEAGAAKPVRLPNAKKEKATFQCTELVKLESEDATQSGTAQYIRQRREIEVGVERFMAATPSEKAFGFGILEKLAAQIHHTIHSVPASRRAELWDSLIIIGNGSKIKGKSLTLLILTFIH
jgi:actin-related protein 9